MMIVGWGSSVISWSGVVNWGGMISWGSMIGWGSIDWSGYDFLDNWCWCWFSDFLNICVETVVIISGVGDLTE
jgi:hypothetical protein